MSLLVCQTVEFVEERLVHKVYLQSEIQKVRAICLIPMKKTIIFAQLTPQTKLNFCLRQTKKPPK